MAKNTVLAADNDKLNPNLAILILLVSLVVFIAIGMAVGYLFFWGKSTPVSKNENDYGKSISQIKRNPNDPQAHIDLGWVYMRQQQYDLAERQYQNALSLDQSNVTALYNLALLKVETGKLNDAKKLLEKAKAIKPGFLQARATLGYVYAESKEYEKAVIEYKTVEKYYSNSSDLMYQFGLLYQKKGDKTKAEQYYLQALRLDPELTKVKEAIKSLK